MIFLTWETLLPAVFVEFLTLFSSSSDQLLLPSSASLLLFALISPYLLSSPNILWSSPLYPSLAATKKFPLFFLSIPKNLEKKKRILSSQLRLFSPYFFLSPAKKSKIPSSRWWCLFYILILNSPKSQKKIQSFIPLQELRLVSLKKTWWPSLNRNEVSRIPSNLNPSTSKAWATSSAIHY